MQVQNTTDSSNVTTVSGCEGSISSCDVGSAGTFKVLDFSNELRWLNISVTGASPGTFPIPAAADCPTSSLPCINTNDYVSATGATLLHEDEFTGESLESSYWIREQLLEEKALHQKPGVYQLDTALGYTDIDGRRDASFAGNRSFESVFPI